MLVNGVDIIEIERVGRVTAEYGDRFLKRIYTDAEIAYCRGRAPQLASRFAAKEAVMKLLGTGTRGIRWKDIEVVRECGKAPTIKLHGTALARAERIGLSDISVSLSHSKDTAIATVVGNSLHGNLVPFRPTRAGADAPPPPAI
ncbi:MAG: holo-[acyl-carrier-protein] synthase [SAR202 cluster bacterium]|nr:holo-[acyl-carrier-protein] synthase [SAR202 cluster bacterium]